MPRDEDALLARAPWTDELASDPFASAFHKNFDALRAAWAQHPQEGLLLAAIDGNGFFDAHAHLRLPASGIGHLILGRHERCDFVLSRDPQVSLRHALVRVTRDGTGQLCLRAIDLRSRVGLLSEDGRRCEAISSRGPLLLRIGRTLLFLLPTGPATRAWTNDPGRTFGSFSPREQEILPPPQPLKSRAAPADGALQLASITIQSNDPQAGDLTTTHAVWSDQLERGVLVGRDDRCSHGGVDEGNLSRVHLVLLSIEDEVWAIDTASTNGTRVAGESPFRQLRLSGETQLLLADALSLRWSPSLHAARA